VYVYVKLHGEYAEKAYLSHHLDLITAGAKSSYKFTPGNINRRAIAPTLGEFILRRIALIFNTIYRVDAILACLTLTGNNIDSRTQVASGNM